MFLKFTIAVLGIYFINFHEICEIKSYPANFMEIDEIETEHYNGINFSNIFLKIKIFD